MVTRGIKNCRDSRLFKGCSPLQLSCNLIMNRPQTATFHTATVSGHNKKMKTTILTLLILILTFGFVNAQTDCKKAIEQAKLDFKKSDFSFHSTCSLP